MKGKKTDMWRLIRNYLSGIRTVLFLSYFILILLSISIVGILSFYISNRLITGIVGTASTQMLKQIENNIDNEFYNKRILLLAPYYFPDYIANINDYSTMNEQSKFTFRRSLGDLVLRSFTTTPIPDFVRVQIYYSTGEFMYSSDSNSLDAATNVRNAPWFRQTIKKDGQVAFFSYKDVASNKGASNDISYSMAIMIRDYANPISFIIVRADYSPKLFKDIEKHANLTKSTEMWILNEHNKPVYVSSGKQLSSVDSKILAQVQGKSGDFWTSSGGDQELVSFTQSKYTNWKTVLIMPKNEIFSPLNLIKSATVDTAILAFFVTSLMSLLFGRCISKPILHLHNTVNKIRQGDFSTRVDIESNDEIGRIAKNFNVMLDELQKMIETKYVYQIRLQQAQLAVLYSQINPHFLYNTLDSIKAMADYHNVEEIGQMAHSLADMFRYNIKNSAETVTLQEELDQVEAYLNIQRIRFEDKITYEIWIDPELKTFPVLKMTLQPLVENAVFHGIERKLGKGTIRITAGKEGGSVILTVSDDGVGMTDSCLDRIRAGLGQPLYEDILTISGSSRGIGIRNVYIRYAIQYGERFQFQIKSENDVGTSISLVLETEGGLNELTRPMFDISHV